MHGLPHQALRHVITAFTDLHEALDNQQHIF
jgi:hypothetical protein